MSSSSKSSPGRRQQQPSSNNNDDNQSRQQQQQRAVKPSSSNSTTGVVVGRRTGVAFPPRGAIPLDDDGLENVDAFFAAAQSPPSTASTPATGSGTAHNYGKRAEKMRQLQKKQHEREERQRQFDELEEEAAQNAKRRPEGFLTTTTTTPKQPPSWSSRMLHVAMGIPTTAARRGGEEEEEDGEEHSSASYSVLSKVSTAAPSTTRKSIIDYETINTAGSIATESRHAMRGKLNQDSLLLEKFTRMQQHHHLSPVNKYGNNDDYYSEEDEEDKHRMRGRAGGGKEEEDDDEDDDNENVDDDDDFHYDGPVDPPEEVNKMSGSQGSKNSRGMDPDEERERERVLVAKSSSKAGAVSGSSAASSKSSSDALENSLEEVVHYHDRYDDDDADGGEGGMQLATQQLDDNDNHSFGGGGGGNDYFGDDDDNNVVASQRSRGSSSKDDDDSAEEEEVPKKKKSKNELLVDKKQKKQQQTATTPVTPTSVLRTSKASKKNNKKKQTANRVNWSTPNGTSKGIPAGPREYEAIPVTDYKANYAPGEEPQTPGGSALRRSRRAKFKPLQFWKNEKLIYEAQNEEGLLGEAMGDMPVVAGVMHALPTPYKEVKRRERETAKPSNKDTKKNKKRKHGDEESGDEEDEDVSRASMEPFDDKALRKKYRIRNGESGTVWSETLESATDTKIVSRLDNRTFSKLPLSSTRSKRESKVVGFASQSFHIPTDAEDLFPGYIAGNVIIPPRGIKDAEGVGLCSQVFTVGDCQPNSLELAVADPTGQDGEFDHDTAQRYLLSKGDMFQIPPGNVYRIENHSKKAKAALYWVIIKCFSKAEQDDDEEEGSEEGW